jgi:hypothetical protein
MSLGGIFALFGFPDGNDDNDEDKIIKKELKEFKDTPHFKVGMFIKMISNGLNFKNQVVGFFSKADKDLDMEGVSEAGDFMMYNRAWYWISKCNLKRKDWKEALSKNATPELVKCLGLTIKYFENIEEYEKCSLLFKIQVFVKKEMFIDSLKDA